MNKKAQLSLFQFMIIGFLAVVFFAGLIWVMGQLNDVFTQVGIANEQASHPVSYFPCIDNASATCNFSSYTNMSLASEQIWGTAYTSIQSLRMVAGVYLLSMMVLIILVGAYERKHPLLFFAYILLTTLAVIFAPTISNAYENLLSSSVFDGELTNFSLANTILLNLPTVVLFVGILGAIFLFINLIRRGGEENLS